MRIAVVGGGISGLTVSFYLRKLLGPALKRLTLIEESENVGGWVRSVRVGTPVQPDGDKPFLFELGPASVRGGGPSAPAVIRLLEACGLQDEALQSSKLSNRRFIYTNKKLVPLPMNLKELMKCPLTSKCGLAKEHRT